jgi:hypothetical protein
MEWFERQADWSKLTPTHMGWTVEMNSYPTLPDKLCLSHTLQGTYRNTGRLYLVAGILFLLNAIARFAVRTKPLQEEHEEEGRVTHAAVVSTIMAIFATGLVASGAYLLVKGRWYTDRTLDVLESMKEGGLFVCQVGTKQSPFICDRLVDGWRREDEKDGFVKLQRLLDQNRLVPLWTTEDGDDGNYLVIVDVCAEADLNRLNGMRTEEETFSSNLYNFAEFNSASSWP